MGPIARQAAAVRIGRKHVPARNPGGRPAPCRARSREANRRPVMAKFFATAPACSRCGGGRTRHMARTPASAHPPPSRPLIMPRVGCPPPRAVPRRACRAIGFGGGARLRSCTFAPCTAHAPSSQDSAHRSALLARRTRRTDPLSSRVAGAACRTATAATGAPTAPLSLCTAPALACRTTTRSAYLDRPLLPSLPVPYAGGVAP